MSQIRTSQIQNLSGTTVLDTSAGTANLAALTAGTTSKAPLIFTGGSLLTTPQDGAIEYVSSNKMFYVTSDAASGQAALDESYFYALAEDRTIVATVVGNTYYSVFGVGLTVAPGTYFVDTSIGLRTGTTSHTVSFAWGGTATYGSVQYRTEFTNLALSTGAAAAGTPTSPVTLMFVGNPLANPVNGVISPASTLASKFIRITGVLVVTGAGTINPQIAFSANPAGTNRTTLLSYIRISPFGGTTLPATFGAWV